jgi:prepilin-type N-terminal cleavage/methylation domain-containing protein
MKARKQRKAFTLVELLVVIVILGILMALLLPAIAAAIKNSKITQCENNLSQLVKAMYNYTITKTPVEGSFPSGSSYEGMLFWLILFTTKEIEEKRVFDCTVAPTGELPPTKCYYKGPNTNANALKSNAAIGADDWAKDSHGHSQDPSVAYNWVAKAGSCHKTPKDSSLWAVIDSTLKK